jgi:hypothetical protein
MAMVDSWRFSAMAHIGTLGIIKFQVLLESVKNFPTLCKKISQEVRPTEWKLQAAHVTIA